MDPPVYKIPASAPNSLKYTLLLRDLLFGLCILLIIVLILILTGVIPNRSL